MPGPCKNCGQDHAAFGYRRRGFLSQLSEKNRTTIWVCGKPECKARAEAWKRKADGDDRIARSRAPDPSPPKPSPKPKADQGSLF